MYWREGDMQNVVWAYQKELSKPMPDNERVLGLTRLAMAQMATENFEAGMAIYQEIAQKYPGHSYAPTALLFQANYAILEKNQLSKGLQIYDELLTKYPKSEAAKEAGQWVPQLRNMTSAELVKKNRERRQQEADASRLAEKKADANLKKSEKDSTR